MPAVWRLTSPAYAHLLDGEGSRMAGGRWNSPGRPMLYTSSHLSLCLLEVFVHIPAQLRDSLPDLEAVRIMVPDDASATELSADEFERVMKVAHPLAACRAFGDAWLDRGEDLVLRAPSVLVAEEHNVMLNPAHEHMVRVRIQSSRRFRFDPRMARSA
jgi:RES domain-containing protein